MAGYVEMEFSTWEEAEKFEANYVELLFAVDSYIKESEKADRGKIEHTLREIVTRKAFQLCGYDIAKMGI